MLRFIKRAKSMPVLVVLAVAMVIAAVTAISPGTASAQELIGNPGVTLYENPNYNNDPDQPGGRSLPLSESVSCLKAESFDNLTESIQVRPGTKVVLFTKCGFEGKAKAFSEHDSDLNDNPILKGSGGGAKGGTTVSVSSVLIIKDTESDGAEHEQLHNRVNKTFDDLEVRMNLLEDTLEDHHDNIDIDLDDHDVNIDTDLDDHDVNIDTDLGNHDTNIDVDLDGRVNPDPFEVTVQTCIALGADAGIGASTSLGRNALGEVGIGVDAYGNGAWISAGITREELLAGALGGSLGIITEACYEGVRVLFEEAPSPQGLGAHSAGTHTAGGADDALITAYEGVGSGLQGGLVATTTALGLGVENVVLAVDAVTAIAESSLLDLNSVAANFGPNGPLADLLLSLPMSSLLAFDIDAALEAVSTPCAADGIIRGLGDAAAAICDTDANDVAEATLDLVNTFPTLIEELLDAVLVFATQATNTAITGVNATIGAVNDPIIAGFNSGASSVLNAYNGFVGTQFGFGPTTIFGGDTLFPRTTIIPRIVITPAFCVPVTGPCFDEIATPSITIGPVRVDSIIIPPVNFGAPFSGLTVPPAVIQPITTIAPF